ncbi:MAG: hypothetical protein A07HB70_01581 [uncultured archaeon A07HB70]|nr:MAG: hypothetical protein A07HB70_01581 [uncultured archaeon A07HB70]
MTDRKLTLLEIRLDDATFTATAQRGDAETGQDETPDRESEAEDDGGCLARRAATALLVVAALGVAAVLASRALGDDALAELADLDDA